MPARDGSMHRLPAYLVELCRRMRHEPTEPEAWLWSCLRARRLAGAKFRRQRPLGRYIADFCCDEARLVIELDGAAHASRAEYDDLRDKYLAAVGYQVLRIHNAELAADPEGVLSRIVGMIEQSGDRNATLGSSSPLEGASPLSPALSPSGGERETRSWNYANRSRPLSP